MSNLRVIAFDADDTLWVNEPIFTEAQERCKAVLEPYVKAEVLETQLYQTEIRNLKLFGYGIKGFMLSMIETAIELSEGKVSGAEIQQLIDLGKEMLQHPVQLLPNVAETIEQLGQAYELMIVTKGDLFDQESKIARSGIADYFSKVEIVSEKDEKNYASILKRNQINPDEFMMVGNSLKSDILPVCKIGARAVHIPFHITWAHETIEQHHVEGLSYQELADISLLPALLQS
jgi:putative hydrolase of the HAD superfamily